MRRCGICSTLLALLLVVSGCAQCSPLKHCCKVPIPNGTVYTGGRYGVQRAIEIPPRGLLLTDAVEESLRPGVALPAAQNVPAAPPGAPVDRQLPNLDDALKSAVGRFPAVNGPMSMSIAEDIKRSAGLVQQIFAAAHFEVDPQPIVTELQAAAAAGDFKTDGPESEQLERGVHKAELRNRLKTIAYFSDSWEANAPTDEQLEKTADRIAIVAKLPAKETVEGAKIQKDMLGALQDARKKGVFALPANAKAQSLVNAVKPFIGDLTSAGIAGAADAKAPAQVSSSAAIPARAEGEALVVALSRRGARRYILPLDAVRSTPLGDIRLSDGDHIDIIPFAATPAGQPFPSNADVKVVLANWASAEKVLVDFEGQPDPNLSQLVSLTNGSTDLADVVVVKRISEVGGLEEILMPLNASDHLTGTFLRPADFVRYDRMELIPLVQQSRAQFASKPAKKQCCLKDPRCRPALFPAPK